jgi:hypothetical protein
MLLGYVDDDATVLTVTTKPVTPHPCTTITSPPQPLPIPITHYAGSPPITRYDDDNPTVAVPIT